MTNYRIPLTRWLLLAIILVLAIVIRLPMLTASYSTTDMALFEAWTRAAVQKGLFGVYANVKDAPEVDHPPLGVTILSVSAKIHEMTGGSLADDNVGFRAALRFVLLIFDVLLIAAGYAIALRLASPPVINSSHSLTPAGSVPPPPTPSPQAEWGSRAVRFPLSTKWRGGQGVRPSIAGGEAQSIVWATLVGAALAFTPGLIADSVWWGQTDGVFSFFLLLTIYAVHRRWITASWALYALTILTKFQGIAVLPLLLILTWQRFGWRGMLRGIVVFAVMLLIGIGPFVLVSGEGALRPYIQSVGKYPYISINAHNFWYWSLSPQYDLRNFGQPTDTSLMFGPFTVRTVGFILFGIAAGLIALRAWLLPDRRDEFLLAAGLYTAFFMFSTQMHERYLYPAVVLMALAMVGSRWLWLVWLGFAATVSRNILDSASTDHLLFSSTVQLLDWANFQNARLNVILMVALFAAIFRKPHPQPLSASSEGSPAIPVPSRYVVERGAEGEANPRRLPLGRVIVITLLVLLLIAEAALRAAYPQLPAWMQDTLQNVRITPFTDWRLSTTPLAQPDRDYGAVVQPGMTDRSFNLADGPVSITTARLADSPIGVRGQPLTPPIDGIALGGADTFCLLNWGDCWINLVNVDNHLTIANWGQPEGGSTARLLMLRNYGRAFRPRVVLWQWSVTDLQADYKLALMQGRTGKLEPPEQLPEGAQRPAACNPILPEYSALYALICALDRWPPPNKTAKAQYGSVNMTLSTNLAPLAEDRPDMQFGYDQMVQALDTANQLARDDLHAPLIILILPTKEEVYSNRASPPLSITALDKLSQSRLRLLQTCQERGWQCVDLYAPLRDQANRGVQVYGSNLPTLNATGHKIVAQAVTDALRLNHVIAHLPRLEHLADATALVRAPDDLTQQRTER
ncbi:MAG: hypothetical protein IT324_33485 [Anaerolineae bacterium]|nr:hypothetical protein [Anaerolineae bacterium]